MFCFCSHMDPSNDNHPNPEASRLLPIVGRVAPDETITPRAADLLQLAGGPNRQPEFPNDPRQL
jgi:hypothetical protein